MNAFNRVLTTLFLLALIPSLTIALIVPVDAVELLGDWLDQLQDQLDPSVSTWQMAIRVGLALLVDLVLILLIYLELRRPPKHGVPVQRVKGGEALIVVDSIVERLNYKIDQLPGVLDVEPEIVPLRRGVEVKLQIETVADANMRANIEEISAVARHVVEEEMGLKLMGKPKLNLRTVIYPEPPVPEREHVPDLSEETGPQEPMEPLLDLEEAEGDAQAEEEDERGSDETKA